MVCKCTKSTESSNLNLQENENKQIDNQDSMEKFTENVKNNS